MQIAHIALYVIDIDIVKDFYVQYFGATSSEMYTNPHTLFSSYFLSFDGPTTMEIMTRPQTVREWGDAFPTGYTHVAFSVGSKEMVDSLTERIKEDGFIVADAPRMTGDGLYQSCVLDPEGNRIEITI